MGLSKIRVIIFGKNLLECGKIFKITKNYEKKKLTNFKIYLKLQKKIKHPMTIFTKKYKLQIPKNKDIYNLKGSKIYKKSVTTIQILKMWHSQNIEKYMAK